MTPSTEGGRKAFVLTDAGRTEAEARGGSAPWDEARDDLGEGRAALMDGLKQVGGALWQVAGAGTPAQQREAAAILADTRSRLYRLLADGAPAEQGATGAPAEDGSADGRPGTDASSGTDGPTAAG